jgi:hypothetical protein
MPSYFQLKLPKWSQMLVSGKQVTVEQAKEIIFRTDLFLTDTFKYAGGNEREFNKNYREKSKLVTIADNRALALQLRQNAKIIYTNFVTNDWASSAFINGPHGWCSPTGEIKFVDNVGKWPTVTELYNDWKLLAEAFPYLDLTVTVIHGEMYFVDAGPVVNIRVLNGMVTLEKPDLTVHPTEVIDAIESGFSFPNELGLPDSWYNEFAKKVATLIDELNTNNDTT